MSHPASTLQVNGGLRVGQSVTVVIRPSSNGADLFGHAAGKVRRAYIVGEPDTFFSIPARVSLGGHKVAGYVTAETVSGSSVAAADDPAIYVFVPYLYGANVRRSLTSSGREDR